MRQGMYVQSCEFLPVHVWVMVGSPTQQEKASIAGAIDSEKALKAETSRAIRGSSYSALPDPRILISTSKPRML